MAAFVAEYVRAHWSELGGDHFIALCTGLNIALLGWENFQNQARRTERWMTGKVASATLTIADSRNAEKFSRLMSFGLTPARILHYSIWNVTYLLAILAVVGGVGMLYLHKSCPYDALLILLPSLVQLLLGPSILGIVYGWMWLIKKGMKIFGTDPDIDRMQIRRFFDRNQ